MTWRTAAAAEAEPARDLRRPTGMRVLLVLAVLVAALFGAAVTAANGWGAPAPGVCRDTITLSAMCVAPGSPAWALALGALAAAAVVVAPVLVVHARRRKRT